MDTSLDDVNEFIEEMDDFFIEEEVQGELEVAASLATISTLGTATGCASTIGTVSCWG